MLKGLKILITAGPTHEPIDPVRFIGNRSTGKMGYALANELLNRGVAITLVSGPVNISIEHHNLTLIKVNTAHEMYEACVENFHTFDGAILSAAVADFTPKNPADLKIKKKEGQNDFILELVKTKDILGTLGGLKSKKQFLIGFSLETHDAINNAKSKLERKNCNLIVMNSLEDNGAGFEYDTNKVTILDDRGSQENFELKSKSDVAKDIVNSIEDYLRTNWQ